MRDFSAIVAMVFCLAACGTLGLLGERVDLLTGVDPDVCYAGGEQGWTGPLVVDPQFGTRFNGQPVMWPTGYSGRRAGSEVQVLDGGGAVRAMTGRIYHISYAPDFDGRAKARNAFPAAVNCGYHWDFIDCTANPADSYCRTE